MAKASPDLRHLARIGAGLRLQQLDQEAAAIRAFLGGRGPAPGAAPERKRRKMSAAGRAAIIAGTKKRWAEWRKKKGRE